MTEALTFPWLIKGVLLAALVSLIVLVWIVAPYGRHARAGWGPTMDAAAGWMAMEGFAGLSFGLVYALGRHRDEPVPLALLSLWGIHYFYRAFVYPLRWRGPGRPTPVLVVLLGATFNTLNGYLNARYASEMHHYPLDGWQHPSFILGIAVFCVGWTINQHADHVLLNLRAPGETGYKIPQGGLYRWIACPNYLGELIQWSGFAIAAESPAAWAFVVFTAANLVPRARAHLKWYRETFPDYPASRRAILPLVF